MSERTSNTPLPELEQAVMVCPQCEGEGGYADGLDENACHTVCTRCGGNGWIVDVKALTRTQASGGANAALIEAAQEFVDRVERGEIRSKRTYAKFKAILATLARDKQHISSGGER
jgi:DnaJ-class molecular chaperone